MKNKYIQTKNGSYKKFNGKYWLYFYKGSCPECGKEIMRPQQMRKKYPNSCCSYKCRDLHKLKYTDIKSYNILSHINTPNFSYMIGLIASDGSVTIPTNTQKNYSVRIELHEKDSNVLYEIQKIFGGHIYKLSPTKYKKCKSILWVNTNRLFVEFLINNVGITPVKSKTLNVTKWFSSISKTNKSHFIRGVFDGDGTLTRAKKREKYTVWVANIVTHSTDFLNLLEDYFKEYNPKVYNDNTVIQFNGSNLIKPLKKIMTNKHLHIKRKYLLFEHILNGGL